MASIGDVATALAKTVSLATGVRATDHVPSNLNPPALFVAFNRLSVVTMARGSVDLWFDCVIFTSKTVDRVGQQSLYEYLSPSGEKSILKAVFDSPTLGLENTSASPVSDDTRALGVEEIAAYGYFGGVVPVLVATDGA